MPPIQITDDEVVAIALTRAVPWPGPIPSVDLGQVPDVERASFRGTRSLLVRGLLSDAGTLRAPLADLVERILGAQLRIDVALCDDTLHRRSWDHASTHYPALGPGTDPWLSEAVTPSGIHTLGTGSPQDQAAYLEALLTSAATAARRPAAQEEPRWLCAIAHSPDRTLVARACRDRVETLEIGDDGLPHGPGAPTSAAAAVDALMHHVARTASSCPAASGPGANRSRPA